MNNSLSIFPMLNAEKPCTLFTLILAITITCAVALPWSQSASAAPQVKARVVTDAQPFPNQPHELNLCPKPFKTRVTATNYSVLQSDMPAQWKPGNGLNGTQRDTHYAHTFYWKTQGNCCSCCQTTKATLNISFRAISNGASPNSADAGNDGFYIVTTNGTNITAGVNGTGQVWSNHPFSAGATVTKTVVITNANILNSGHLSVLVQDDTAITAATLTVTGCCVNSGCCARR